MIDWLYNKKAADEETDGQPRFRDPAQDRSNAFQSEAFASPEGLQNASFRGTTPEERAQARRAAQRKIVERRIEDKRRAEAEAREAIERERQAAEKVLADKRRAERKAAQQALFKQKLAQREEQERKEAEARAKAAWEAKVRAEHERRQAQEAEANRAREAAEHERRERAQKAEAEARAKAQAEAKAQAQAQAQAKAQAQPPVEKPEEAKAEPEPQGGAPQQGTAQDRQEKARRRSKHAERRAQAKKQPEAAQQPASERTPEPKKQPARPKVQAPAAAPTAQPKPPQLKADSGPSGQTAPQKAPPSPAEEKATRPAPPAPAQPVQKALRPADAPREDEWEEGEWSDDELDEDEWEYEFIDEERPAVVAAPPSRPSAPPSAPPSSSAQPPAGRAPQARQPQAQQPQAPQPQAPQPQRPAQQPAPPPPAPPPAPHPGPAQPQQAAPQMVPPSAPPPPPPPAAPPQAAAAAPDDGEERPVDREPPPIPDDPLDAARAALRNLKVQTDLSNCVVPILEALHWRGDPRHVAEALPHFIDGIDITSFRNVLATLHFESRPVPLTFKRLDPRLLPCLFLPQNGDAMVVLEDKGDSFRVFDGGTNTERDEPKSRAKGTAYFFAEAEVDDMRAAANKVGWFKAVGERFSPLIYQALGITLVLNLLALATPLFVMAVYDKVVATKSLPTLGYFAVGVLIALACDIVLRSVRSRILAYIGARLDNIVGNAVFHRILFLPPAFTERATIGAQVARMKDFESVRDFFTGPMALVLFELPFVFIFVVAILVLGGPLVIIPLIMLALYAVLGYVMAPLIRNGVSRAARAGSQKQEFLVEALNNMRAIKYSGAEGIWMDRFRDLSAKTALAGFHTATLSAITNTIAHVLMIGSGVSVITFGVVRVLEGDMTVGSLVASMILVWRVLSPLQTGFLALTRVTQVKSSIQQIDNLMKLRAEREQNAQITPISRMEGHVSFGRVSLRYSADADPALVGISFDAEPGEVIGIVGPNGCGKSTVLKLLVGMYQPQAGSIRIDNLDIRQLDPVELRHAISYVPQNAEFFYGTIGQNLRLAQPTATVEEMEWACERAGCLNEVLALEQGSGKWKRTGFDVRVGDSGAGQMPSSFQQKLSLARGFLKRSPIMLFDEPGNSLDFEGDQLFMKAVNALRGDTTMLLVTHRPSHIRICDKLLWLDTGAVRGFGPTEEVRAQMPKDLL
ncbi:MAG: ABC transporter transmembrane domain-containing protein [Magnetovibrionaceae bacterium]